MGNLFLLALAAFAGGLLPFQAGANARLAAELPTRMHGALVNFLVGGVALALLLLPLGWRDASLARLSTAPWWAWIGGFIGAIFVSVGIFVAPRTGTVVYLAALLVGQILSSLLVDHFGLVGLPVQRITLDRVAGVALLCLGMYLVQRGIYR